MHEVRTTGKVSHWPSPQDYNEAIQNPSTCFQNGLLQSAQPELDCFGLPKPISGGFASVYKMNHGENARAVRCFLLRVEEQERRYGQVSNYLRAHASEYTLPFKYLSHGIKVNSKWFPILNMEWSQGQTLDQFIESNISNPATLAALPEQFLRLQQQLQDAEMAHGDLQHGNILVTKRGMILVDYDGMFVPTMRGQSSLECGHRNYQHPARCIHHFGSYLDNFSAWVIYASLEAIARDPFLYKKLNGGADCLLLRESDYLNPSESETFSTLEDHNDPRIVNLARFVRGQLERKVELVPKLQRDPPAFRAQPLRANNSFNRTTVDPWWLDGTTIKTETPVIDIHSFASTSIKQVPSSSSIAQSLHEMPVELNQPLPRRVGFNSKCARMSPVLKQLLILAAPPAWMPLMILWTALTSSLLYTYGNDMTGMVTATSTETNRTKYGIQKNNVIEYQYSNDSNMYRHTIKQPMNMGIAVPKVGDPVFVRTLGPIELGDPAPRFSASEPYKPQLGLLGLLPLFGPLFLGLEVWIWAEAIKHWQLARNGLCTSGVIHTTHVITSSKGEKYYKCSYSFRADGNVRYGKMNIAEKEYYSIERGDKVAILYSKNDPDMSCIHAFAYMNAKP